MAIQIIIVIILTFVINLVTTLSYAVRLVGVRTNRVAISFALFNILVLIARTANGFQAPILAKTVENDIKNGIVANTEVFRYIILSCTLATIVGALLIPSFQKILSKAVVGFSAHKSMGKLLLQCFSRSGMLYIKANIAMPVSDNFSSMKFDSSFPWRIFIVNVVAVSVVTVGVLSAVYASYLNPEYRNTASNLSAFVNGFSTILMFVFVDPHLSVMADDVVLGKCSDHSFKTYIGYMILARFGGTLLAQILFLPVAELLARTATYI